MRLVTIPLGLAGASDAQILLLERELDPPPFDGTEGRIISLLVIAIEFTLFRSFWSSPPHHMTYRPPLGRWDSMVLAAQRAIAWAATDQGAYYLDVWALLVYPLVICTIIQLRAYVATRSPAARESILLAQSAFTKWDTDKRRTRKRIIIDLLDVIVSATEPEPEEPAPVDWGWLDTSLPTIEGLGNLEDIDLFNLLNMPV